MMSKQSFFDSTKSMFHNEEDFELPKAFAGDPPQLRARIPADPNRKWEQLFGPPNLVETRRMIREEIDRRDTLQIVLRKRLVLQELVDSVDRVEPIEETRVVQVEPKRTGDVFGFLLILFAFVLGCRCIVEVWRG
jgi:hypothetical protein